MRLEQFEETNRVEDTHWWFVGLRELLESILVRRQSCVTHGSAVVDVGCGTGANLRMLNAVFPNHRLFGFDIADIALKFAHLKCPTAVVYRDDFGRPEKLPEEIGLLFSVDAFYMSDEATVRNGLKLMVEHMREGGLFVGQLPAAMPFLSFHDRAMGTRERYTVKRLQSLMLDVGLTVERIGYRVSALYPLILATRMIQFGFGKTRRQMRSDLALPVKCINGLLCTVMRFENWLLLSGGSLPFGCSVFVIASKSRKKTDCDVP